jgi:hypothetical protein
MIEWLVLRWNMEGTFEEGRCHLGWASLRQWSAKAIARTTPALFGLFALVGLMAYRLIEGRKLVPQSTMWYLKEAATFSDVLAWVRRAPWARKYFPQPSLHDDPVLLRPRLGHPAGSTCGYSMKWPKSRTEHPLQFANCILKAVEYSLPGAQSV